MKMHLKYVLSFIIVAWPLTSNSNVSKSPPVSSENTCYNTDEVIGLCAGGLSKTTYKKMSLTLNSIHREKKTVVVGALVDILLKDRETQSQPVMKLIESYFKCVNDVLGFSKLLVAETDDKNKSEENLAGNEKLVQAKFKETSAVIQETFSKAAIVSEKINLMNPVEMGMSLDAINALSKIVIPVGIKDKTRLEIFFKNDKVDTSFKHDVLFKIFEKKGFTVENNNLDEILSISSKQLELNKKIPVNKWHHVNAIWFNQSKTPIEHVKIAALIMIAAGAKIETIQPFCEKSSRSKYNVIQVGAFPNNVRNMPYTANEVLNATSADFIRIDKCK